jgi:hypothetical protein
VLREQAQVKEGDLQRQLQDARHHADMDAAAHKAAVQALAAEHKRELEALFAGHREDVQVHAARERLDVAARQRSAETSSARQGLRASGHAGSPVPPRTGSTDSSGPYLSPEHMRQAAANGSNSGANGFNSGSALSPNGRASVAGASPGAGALAPFVSPASRVPSPPARSPGPLSPRSAHEGGYSQPGRDGGHAAPLSPHEGSALNAWAHAQKQPQQTPQPQAPPRVSTIVSTFSAAAAATGGAANGARWSAARDGAAAWGAKVPVPTLHLCDTRPPLAPPLVPRAPRSVASCPAPR